MDNISKSNLLTRTSWLRRSTFHVTVDDYDTENDWTYISTSIYISPLRNKIMSDVKVPSTTRRNQSVILYNNNNESNYRPKNL